MASGSTRARDKTPLQEVEEDFRRTGVFVDEHAFNVCSDRIRPWIDIPTLMPYLYRYGLVKGEDCLYYLGDRVPPSQRKTYLLNTLTSVPYGHHLLYLCIRDARESLGHQSAAKILRENGTNRLPTPDSENPQLHLPPPPPMAHSAPPTATPTPGPSSSSRRQEVEIREEVKEQGTRVRYEKKTTTTETRFNQGGASPLYDNEGAMVTPVQESCPDEEHCNVPASESSEFMRGGSVDSDTLNPSGVDGGRREAKREATVQDSAQALAHQAEVCHAQVKDKVEGGAIAELEADDNQYLFHHTSRDRSQSQLSLIQMTCNFVAGCLNAREMNKGGVFVGGVRPESDEKPFVLEGLPNIEPDTIEQNLKLALKRAVFTRSGGEKAPLTSEELRMVRITCCEVDGTSSRNPNKAHLLLVTVHPQWSICKDRLYVTCYPDKNGKRDSEQVHTFVNRSLVEESIPRHVTDLQRVLKDKYMQYCDDT